MIRIGLRFCLSNFLIHFALYVFDISLRCSLYLEPIGLSDFPTYLTWLNSVGGYDSWLFFNSNQEKISTKIENAYVKNIDDLETAIGNIDITGKSIAPQIDFGALVSEGSMDGMASLYGSPKVLHLKNPETWQTDGAGGTPLPKWQRVIIKTGSLVVIESKKALMNVKMSMLLPTRDTQKE